ncbi:hypothetical protein AMAG_15201 [Allomyces macrogynus ATCC 38327]|uniref:Hsp70-like protein n=1 Tax=Allomyces macrogynus (strain ATCC 38327) TaxID=578462 RepID=A0A0L0T6P5_ALLM3|nr:hypothetical protein AMAG_15201 [Allomyces macrogynus ATCC 38327]|eukprot:KNE70234.1 hypothetical protein AMAG_15201 [Allomyces macrogynus ATCC 38327]
MCFGSSSRKSASGVALNAPPLSQSQVLSHSQAHMPGTMNGPPPPPQQPQFDPYGTNGSDRSNGPPYQGYWAAMNNTTPPQRPISMPTPMPMPGMPPPAMPALPTKPGGIEAPPAYSALKEQTDLPPVKFMVGIDFGTTFTGFAIFRVPDDQRGKLGRVSVTRNTADMSIIGKDDWEDQPQGVFSQKTPTIIAYPRENPSLDPRWGWTAKRGTGADSFTRIERIKLALEPNTPEIMRPTVPPNMQPVDIIADYLACLRVEMLRIIATSYPTDTGLVADDFLFCFTVPVGWSHEAHQGIRRAAARAGLISNENSKHLLFCYEPEAAALACVHESPFTIQPNSSMLVVDCGGGTADLFLCRLDADNELEELTVGDGNFAGATSVDTKFEIFMRNKIGLKAYRDFKTKPEFHRYYNDMEMRWESLKRSFSGTQDEHFTLPPALVKIMPAEKAEALQDMEIHVTDADMRSFFDPAVEQIIDLVRKQLYKARETGLAKVKYLYVVGGFGCNRYLQQRITSDPEIASMIEFPVSPRRPEAAVVRGAVWCCINHQSIKSRRARKTIGIGVLRHFNPAMDVPEEITTYDQQNPTDLSRAFVSKAVYCFLTKGQAVPYNAVYSRSGFKVYTANQSTINVTVFASDSVPDQSNVPGVTAPLRLEKSACTELGTISIEIPPAPPGAPLPSFAIEIGYGRVELSVRIVDENTGQQWSQFLNHGSFNIRAPSSAAA